MDPDDEDGKTTIIREWMAEGDAFRDNYDLRLSFNTDDPLYAELEMEHYLAHYRVKVATT